MSKFEFTLVKQSTKDDDSVRTVNPIKKEVHFVDRSERKASPTLSVKFGDLLKNIKVSG
jgi:hypothetical protein